MPEVRAQVLGSGFAAFGCFGGQAADDCCVVSPEPPLSVDDAARHAQVLKALAAVRKMALPAIQEDLGATSSDLQWIVDSYTLVFAGLLLTAGSLGDR